ncbi:hypothetical protein LCGC14_0566710 [marine sediment metagenome]|uniref:NTP pyrophosphohydrolase MazG putative catalytic core domain-containing protein n=1 Tax=marine sediment metagenome TaxID=412755 RepID=A0A0F9RQI0_9ZZZZ
MTTLRDIIIEVKEEYLRACRKFDSFHNAHEGYAVLLEEVDELWMAIKLNQRIPYRDKHIREEAIQVCAMALRLIWDCCREEDL